MHLNAADTLTAVMNGAAATTNPTVMIQYAFPLGLQTVVAPLNGTTPVTLLTGVASRTDINSITISNVDTQSNVVTVTGTIGGVTANLYVLTMAAGDSMTIDVNGNVKSVNLNGQVLTQLTAPSAQITSLIGTADTIPPHTAAQYVVNKAGVDAMTLAAPTATTDDGKVIVVFSNTSNAHTITATGLLYTGTANVNVATFAAQKGAGLTLEAYQAKWIVLASVGITFS